MLHEDIPNTAIFSSSTKKKTAKTAPTIEALDVAADVHTKPSTKETKKTMSTAAKKAPTPKATAKPEPSSNGHKKEGLRAPQVRILQALSKAKSPLTRKQISEKAPCDLAFLTEYMGSQDDEIRAKNDAKMMSLRSLGYVKVEFNLSSPATGSKGREGAAYSITLKGKTALLKAQKG